MKENMLLLSLAALLLLAACRQQQIAMTDIQLEISVSDRRVGETTLLVTVRDKSGKVIDNPGTLSVRGDMDHAGMMPVFAEGETATNGVFTVPFAWTMGGGWTIEASLNMENGDIAKETFHFEILTEASEDGHDHKRVDGESSAIYMTISNQGDSDITIIALESAAGRVEFHQTIVDNDIARMEALDALTVPAGESVELRPGGIHIMLTDLTADLLPATQLHLQLVCDKGELYDLDISVQDMLMGELDDAVDIGGLVFSNRWARPARAGAMPEMEDSDMEMSATPAG